jgi:hypothetical protein
VADGDEKADEAEENVVDEDGLVQGRIKAEKMMKKGRKESNRE